MMLSIRATEMMASPRFDNLKYDESNKVKPLDLTKGCRTTFLELAIWRNFAPKKKKHWVEAQLWNLKGKKNKVKLKLH